MNGVAPTYADDRQTSAIPARGRCSSTSRTRISTPSRACANSSPNGPSRGARTARWPRSASSPPGRRVAREAPSAATEFTRARPRPSSSKRDRSRDVASHPAAAGLRAGAGRLAGGARARVELPPREPRCACRAAALITAGMSRCGSSSRRCCSRSLWSAVAPQLVHQLGAGRPGRRQRCPPFGMQRDTILAEARAVATGRAPGGVQPAGARAGRAVPRGDRRAIDADRPRGHAADRVCRRRPGRSCACKPDFAARTRVERAVMAVAAARLAGRDPRPRSASSLSLVFETVRFFGMVSPDRFPVRHPLGARSDEQRRPARRQPLRRAAAVLGHDLHRRDHRHDRRHPARPDERDLPHPICRPALAQVAQARARDPRRRADGGLRLFRRADRRARDPRRGAARSASPTPRARARWPRAW